MLIKLKAGLDLDLGTSEQLFGHSPRRQWFALIG